MILLSEKESTRNEDKVLINVSWAATAIGGRCSMSQTEPQSWDLGSFQTGRFYFLESMKLHHKLMDEYKNSLFALRILLSIASRH